MVSRTNHLLDHDPDAGPVLWRALRAAEQPDQARTAGPGSLPGGGTRPSRGQPRGEARPVRLEAGGQPGQPRAVHAV